MKKINYVLWTGGWDSTFRVIQLYRLGATIRPIYVLDHNRISSKRELETIHKLSNEIPKKFKNSTGKILELKTTTRNEIPSNRFLKIVHMVLREKVKIGKQYYWLASYARKNKNLEVSFHKEDLDKFFSKEQLTEIKDVQLGSNWKINPKKVDFFKAQLFKNMLFPLIEFTKPKMRSIAQDDDFIDLMDSTWFCHKSNEKSCGKCAPCKQYVRDGFGYRLE